MDIRQFALLQGKFSNKISPSPAGNPTRRRWPQRLLSLALALLLLSCQAAPPPPGDCARPVRVEPQGHADQCGRSARPGQYSERAAAVHVADLRQHGAEHHLDLSRALAPGRL
ncbi:MAG: hypothetical protein WAU95_03385 [Anaerolineae bacterium]